MTSQGSDTDAAIQASGEPTLERATKKAQEMIQNLFHVSLSVAVTGETGVGKSSFINAVRGIGSTSFKAKTYSKKMQFDKYDFFIIISSTRFKENDLMLAKEIQKRKKQFYFIRSKIDSDIDSEKRKKNFNEEETLLKIRRNCEENLKEFGNPKVFLIFSMDLSKFDFEEFVATLLTELPQHKQHALLQSVPVSSLAMLERKVKMFEKVVWAAAIVSGGIAVVPVPGLSFACDMAIVGGFFTRCYYAFGLDDKSLKKLSERVNKPHLKSLDKSPLLKDLAQTSTLRMGGSALVEYLCSLVPGFGSTTAASISFTMTRDLLQKGLKELAEEARQVLREAGLNLLLQTLLTTEECASCSGGKFISRCLQNYMKMCVCVSCGVNVRDGGKRDTNDLLSRPHYSLQGLAFQYSVVPTPGSDAAAQDALDGSSVEGGEDGRWVVCLRQPSQEVETLLGSLGCGAGVEGPGEILCQVNSLVLLLISTVEPYPSEVNNHLFRLVYIQRQPVDPGPLDEALHDTRPPPPVPLEGAPVCPSKILAEWTSRNFELLTLSTNVPPMYSGLPVLSVRDGEVCLPILTGLQEHSLTTTIRYMSLDHLKMKLKVKSKNSISFTYKNQVSLSVAVTGETGTGKSTFINAVRGLDDDDEGAAETGVTETTMEPTPYKHPTIPNVEFWDLPGIGTTDFKAKTYSEEMKFDKYDFFIIISSTRFKENDLMLAKEIQKRKKQFYFIRSKIDSDIDSEKRKKSFNEEETLLKIRRNCEENLKEFGNPKVFLISSMDLSKFDFEELVDTLLTELPQHKQYALLQSVPVSSLAMLERKVKMFEKAVWAAAIVSGGNAVAPLPGLSFACDIAIVGAFFTRCYYAFGLDDKSLEKLSKRMNKPHLISLDKSSLLKELIQKTAQQMGGSAVKESQYSLAPGVGSAAAAAISFGMTCNLLQKGLERLADEARKVLREAGL
ncbi:hypothetical protein NFI96_023183, partial [Prochilodus magdalenae]